MERKPFHPMHIVCVRCGLGDSAGYYMETLFVIARRGIAVIDAITFDHGAGQSVL